MIKKIIVISFMLFWLSSCFFSDDETTQKSNNTLLTKIDRKDFTMSLPSSWEVIKSNDSIFPKPAFWEIVLDAKSKNKTWNIYRNILILKEELNKNIDSLDYIVSNYLWAKKNYYYIKLLKDINVLIDNKKTKIYVFEAKYSEDTPIYKFIQTWIVCSKEAYIITIALEKDNNNIDRYTQLLGTFKCGKTK